MEGVIKRELLVAGTFLALAGGAFAHEGKAHGKKHKDAQMAKLHAMMPAYLKSKARVEAALEKGDGALVAKEADRILATAADLRKSKPHKHLNELQVFQGLADKFDGEVKRTAELARKGDLPGAKAAFAEAESTCNDCHRKFR